MMLAALWLLWSSESRSEHLAGQTDQTEYDARNVLFAASLICSAEICPSLQSKPIRAQISIALTWQSWTSVLEHMEAQKDYIT